MRCKSTIRRGEQRVWASSHLRDDRAFAILLVIMVLAALVIVGAPFALTMGQHHRESRTHVARVQAMAGARGAANYALATLLRGYDTYEVTNFGQFSSPAVDTPDELKISLADLRFDDSAGQQEFFVADPRGFLWSAEAWDEQGKVSLNRASAQLIHNLLLVLGLERTFFEADGSTTTLSAQIVRHRNQVRPLRTIEEIRFAAAPYGAEGSIDADYIERLRRHATVHSAPAAVDQPPPVNINTATWQVVAALLYTRYPPLTLGKAKFAAQRLDQAHAELSENVLPPPSGATEAYLPLDSVAALPSSGCVAVEGDLIRYDGRDEAVLRLIGVSLDPELGISMEHAAGVEARFALASPADLYAFFMDLAARYPDDFVAADVVPALYAACFQPGSTQVCFRSYDVYSVDAKAMVNDPSGIAAGFDSIYEIVHAVPIGAQVWELRSQEELEEHLRMMTNPRVVTWPNALWISGQGPDRARTNLMALPAAAGAGDDTLSVPDSEGFMADNKVKLAKGDLVEYAPVDQVVGATSLGLSNPLQYGFELPTQVSDPGGVALTPAHLFDGSSDLTFVLHLDNAKPEDIFRPSKASGTPDRKDDVTAGTAQLDDVSLDGVHITAFDKALLYRGDDGNLAFTAGTSQRKNLSSGAIEFWFKPHWEDRSEDHVLFDIAENEYLNRLALFYDGANERLVFRIADNTLAAEAAEIRVPVTDQAPDPDNATKLDTIPILNDTWYHVLAVWKGSGYGRMALLIDGKSVGYYWPVAWLRSSMDELSTSVSLDDPHNAVPASGPILVDGEIIDRTGGSVLRGARGTTARPHKAGVPVVPYGYNTTIVQSRDGVTYPDPFLMNLTAGQRSTLQEDLPEEPVTTTINLVHAAGPILRDTDTGGQHISDDRLMPDAPYIPVADGSAFGDTGYAYIDGAAGKERVYYGKVEPKTIGVVIRNAEGNEVNTSITTDVLTDLERGVLYTVAGSFQNGDAVTKISVRVSDHSHYPRGSYLPGSQFTYTLPGEEPATFDWGGEPGGTAHVEVEDEWIGYTFPTTGADDDHARGTFGGRFYLIGLTALARGSGGTERVAHAAGTGSRLAPVFLSGGTFGKGDVFTLADNLSSDNTGREERTVKHATPRGNLFSLTTPIAGTYLYTEDARAIKFPSGQLPQTLQEYFRLGKSALGDSAGAAAVIDEFKIYRSNATIARLLDVHRGADYQDDGLPDGDSEPDPPLDKQVPFGGGDRGDILLAEDEAPPFTLMVGNVNLDGFSFSGWSALPRVAYVKIDEECLFVHALYYPDAASADGQGSFTETSNRVEVAPAAGFPAQGYLYISVVRENPAYVAPPAWLNDPAVLAELQAALGPAYESFISQFSSDPLLSPLHEYVFYTGTERDAEGRVTAFTGLERGLLDSTPTSGAAIDDMNKFTVSLIPVEYEVLERATLGTRAAVHRVGAPLMPLRELPVGVALGPLTVDENDPDPDPKTATLELLTAGDFSGDGILQIGPAAQPEAVAFTAQQGSRTFTVPLALRERLGTRKRTNGGTDVLRDGLADLDTDDDGQPDDPTPAYAFDDDPAARIVRLIPYRYWDGTPRPIADGEPADYDCPGAAFYRISRVLPGVLWYGITWEATLPDDTFAIRAIARVHSATAPGWDEDPKLTCDGKEDGLVEVNTPPGGDPAILNNINAAGDDIEARLFFVYPEGAYDPESWAENRWKKTPVIEGVTLRYEAYTAGGRVLYRKAKSH